MQGQLNNELKNPKVAARWEASTAQAPLESSVPYRDTLVRPVGSTQPVLREQAVKDLDGD